MKLKVLPLLALFFIGCAHVEKGQELKQLVYSDQLMLDFSKENLKLKDFRETQTIRFTHGEQSHTATMVIQFKDDTLKLVVLSPIGMNLLEASYKDGVLQQQGGEFLPKNFQVEFVLLDILLVYMSEDQLKRVAKGPLHLSQEQGAREIYLKNQKTIEISYSPSRQSAQKILYNNLERNYQFEIVVIKKNAAN